MVVLDFGLPSGYGIDCTPLLLGERLHRPTDRRLVPGEGLGSPFADVGCCQQFGRSLWSCQRYPYMLVGSPQGLLVSRRDGLHSVEGSIVFKLAFSSVSSSLLVDGRKPISCLHITMYPFSCLFVLSL